MSAALSIPQVAKGGGSNTTLAGGSSGFATGSGTIHERDESVVAAGSGVGTDGARLADLCREDKAKVARLMQASGGSSCVVQAREMRIVVPAF